jgi:hypothetical protein
MTVIRIKSARLAAPSFKSRAIAGMGKMVRGQVPLSRVVVARDEAGYQWVHNTVFASRDGVKADRIAEAVHLAALTNIEREARQISAACEAVRRILKAERDKEFDASNAALDARKAKRK